MTRVDWNEPGRRYFEAGVDRGVLYVGDAPGVPWVGLISVKNSASGGDPKPRYLDGVKISNHAGPEQYEGQLDAFTHPAVFDACNGVLRYDNGLRVSQQRRKSFGLSYRTQVGNDIDGIGHAYKIHILYNLLAKPAERGYETIGDDTEPMEISWDLSSRGVMVSGMRPVSHFDVDSRDVPAELLGQLEDILYGTDEVEPSLPSPGEIIFLFDSYMDLVYDAGTPYTPYFITYDAGTPSTPIDDTIDGGAL